MSDIDISAIEPAEIRPRQASSGGASRQSALNSALAIVLVGVLALAPLFLGSNRPLAWVIWGAAIGLTALVYALRLRVIGERLRFSLSRLRLEIALAAIIALYMVAQLLPLGEFVIPVAGQLTLTAPQISVAPGATILMLIRFITYGLFFLLMLQVSVQQRRQAQILDALLLIVVAYALYGLLALFQFGDTILGAPKWAYPGSATGPFVNRNSFATFLALGAAIASARLVSRLFRTEADGRKPAFDGTTLLFALALAILLATTLATESRMGLVVWLIACATVLVCTLGKVRTSALLVLFAVPAILVLGGVALVLYGSDLMERLGSVENSAAVRLDVYKQTLELIAQRPFLGFGGGSFEQAFQLVHKLPVSTDLYWDRAHNTYLSLWSELGIPVGSLLPLIISLIGMRVLATMTKGVGNWAAQAACLGAIGAGGLHSLLDFSLEIQAVTFLFLAICAVGLAASITPTTKER